jgi:hypothetical protein
MLAAITSEMADIVRPRAWNASRRQSRNRSLLRGTKGSNPSLSSGESGFGADVDYAQLIKLYGEVPHPAGRYSPAQIQGTKTFCCSGNPDPDHISTSYVERQNITMRMSMRRFTRLTNAFSKKIENHAHAISLHYMHYNFARIHKTLRVTPAMAAGVTNTLWNIEDIAALIKRDGRLTF